MHTQWTDNYIKLDDKPWAKVNGLMVLKHRKTASEIIDYFTCLHKERYTYENTKIRTDYLGTDRVYVTCRQHGDFSIEIRNHAEGDGCPVCPKKKSDKQCLEFTYTANYLYDRRIPFHANWSTKECCNPVDNHRLNFSFYVPDYNILIDFINRRHYIRDSFDIDIAEAKADKQLKHFRRFLSIRQMDSIKKEYAKLSCKRLLRIHFYDKKLTKEILDIAFQNDSVDVSSTTEYPPHPNKDVEEALQKFLAKSPSKHINIGGNYPAQVISSDF